MEVKEEDSYFQISNAVNEKLSANFSSNEFTCRCGKCVDQKISKDLIQRLQRVRDDYGLLITTTSGYRCLAHNTAIGGAKSSQHLLGDAVDIRCKDLDKLYAICEKYFTSIGDGRPKGFIHVDIRPATLRWLY